jgi:uncharacterized membrane protein (DUF4010 family)
LLISVVLLPILPNKGFGPWQALNPCEIWWMVVLIALISFVGYFAVKIAGARRGLVYTALFGGLASSTALTLHYSRASRGDQALAPLLATGILLACGTMLPRMVVIASVLKFELFMPLLLPAALGIADVDAITLSLARMTQDDLLVQTAVTGMVLAAAVNNSVKGGMAAFIGGRDVGLRVGVPLLGSAIGGLIVRECDQSAVCCMCCSWIFGTLDWSGTKQRFRAHAATPLTRRPETTPVTGCDLLT